MRRRTSSQGKSITSQSGYDRLSGSDSRTTLTPSPTCASAACSACPEGQEIPGGEGGTGRGRAGPGVSGAPLRRRP